MVKSSHLPSIYYDTPSPIRRLEFLYWQGPGPLLPQGGDARNRRRQSSLYFDCCVILPGKKIMRKGILYLELPRRASTRGGWGERGKGNNSSLLWGLHCTGRKRKKQDEEGNKPDRNASSRELSVLMPGEQWPAPPPAAALRPVTDLWSRAKARFPVRAEAREARGQRAGFLTHGNSTSFPLTSF